MPQDIWILPIATLNHPEETAAIRRDFPPDITSVSGHERAPLPTRGDMFALGEYVDEWGCTFCNIQRGVIGEVTGAAPMRAVGCDGRRRRAGQRVDRYVRPPVNGSLRCRVRKSMDLCSFIVTNRADMEDISTFSPLSIHPKTKPHQSAKHAIFTDDGCAIHRYIYQRFFANSQKNHLHPASRTATDSK